MCHENTPLQWLVMFAASLEVTPYFRIMRNLYIYLGFIMMMRVTTLLTGLLLAVSAHAERIDNFVLLDQHGDAHNLYYHKDKSAIVVMIQGNGCAIVRNALTDYKALRDQYADQGVHFLMLNSNLQDQRSTILAEAEKYGIDMPILHDESQLIGESLNLIRTAEVLIIDPKTWNIVCRGPINDRQVYERQKAQASEPLFCSRRYCGYCACGRAHRRRQPRHDGLSRACPA